MASPKRVYAKEELLAILRARCAGAGEGEPPFACPAELAPLRAGSLRSVGVSVEERITLGECDDHSTWLLTACLQARERIQLTPLEPHVLGDKEATQSGRVAAQETPRAERRKERCGLMSRP